MRYLLLIFIIVGSLSLPGRSFAQEVCHCDKFITTQETYVDGRKLLVSPGDTVCLKAGKKRSLKLMHFIGTQQKPIVLINQGGQVQIGDPDWHFGLVIEESRHFVLTGTGDSHFNYGILIDQTKKGANGLAIGATDFEVDHVEISRTGFAGLMAKIDPSCDPATWQENFLMQNVSIHHNYIHHTGGEGMYIGYTQNEKTVRCDGQEMTVHPHDIKNIQVFENDVAFTGWDGIQVSRAEGCRIYNNKVFRYGEKNEKWQKAGIVIGGATQGEVYNNQVTTGTGSSLQVFSPGNLNVYNNIFMFAQEDGIFIKSMPIVGTNVSQGIVLAHNSIIAPARFAIKLHQLPEFPNVVANNYLVQSENHFFDNASGSPVEITHNVQTAHQPVIPEHQGMLQPSATILAKIKGKAITINQIQIQTDFYGNLRSKNQSADIGAIEYP